MKRSKIPWAVIIISPIAIVVILASVMYHMAFQTEERRKRDADAIVVANALTHYIHENDGELPSSLKEIDLEGNDIDLSPFKLLSRSAGRGLANKDVVVEAEQAGNGKRKILIYEDGDVRWE